LAKDHVKMTIEEELKDIGARLEKIEVELSSLVKEGRIGKNERQLLWMAGIVVSVLVASVGFGQSRAHPSLEFHILPLPHRYILSLSIEGMDTTILTTPSTESRITLNS